MTSDPAEFILGIFNSQCCADVSRKGESQPCGKVAVAVTVDDEDGLWWPVCAYHTRGHNMVPLAELIAAIRNRTEGGPAVTGPVGDAVGRRCTTRRVHDAAREMVVVVKEWEEQ